MLATYQNGWNKEDYLINGESYHTAHSDFTVTYTVPEGYTVVSSAEHDATLGQSAGQLEITNVKEVFVAILKNMELLSKQVDGIDVRIYGRPEQIEFLEAGLDIATDAMQYFQRNIGPYPSKQIDLILDDGVSMEYPGIVTINPSDDPIEFKNTIAHEIAHQWFYGVISNDSYHDSWLDEGMAVLSASIFLYDHEKLGEKESLSYASSRYLAARGESKVSNLPLSEYQQVGEVVAYVYAQPALKLWELFKENGGVEEGLRFLNAYYETYAYKQLDTSEFVRFAKAYFSLDDYSFFESWLKLERE